MNPQDNESSNLNEMDMSVNNVDVNVDYWYMNNSTGSVIKSHNYIEYTRKEKKYLPKYI